MDNRQHFQFCPRCGAQGFAPQADKSLHCAACGFVFFLNAASAVGGIITDEQGRILLLRRLKDPGKGKLGLPGGFIDAGETVEAALRREVREEVNLELASVRYLCSHPNQYHYKGVTYPVLDLFFVCTVDSLRDVQALDEVESFCFLGPEQIDLDQVAFPSAREALRLYQTATARPWALSQAAMPVGVFVGELMHADHALACQVAALGLLAWGREATPADVEERAQALQEELTALDPAERGLLIARQADAVVGFVQTQRTTEDPSAWWLERLMVHPRYRRQGIATALTHTAIAYARRHGAKLIRSRTHADNETSLRWHKHFGFHHDHVLTAADGDRLVEFRLRVP